MARIKFWENFKTISDFQATKHKRRCWNKCHQCQNDWNQTNTKMVHMLNYQDPKEYVNGNGTFFVCDSCKSKIST